MPDLVWTDQAAQTYNLLRDRAIAARKKRQSGKARRKKSSKAEGLFKQVAKCADLLSTNPRHPGLQTHPYSSIPNPYDKSKKTFEAYVQQHTPGAYRLFWCYGPGKDQITIIAITPHP